MALSQQQDCDLGSTLEPLVVAIDLDQLEALPILNDGTRDYIYDLPTVDDPTRGHDGRGRPADFAGNAR